MTNNQFPKYDLEERTVKFGESIIDFAKKVPQTPITIPLTTQLVKARTSVNIYSMCLPNCMGVLQYAHTLECLCITNVVLQVIVRMEALRRSDRVVALQNKTVLSIKD
jgi:hypothetical protein